MRALPDSIVLLAPTSWPLSTLGVSIGLEQLAESWQATWAETFCATQTPPPTEESASPSPFAFDLTMVDEPEDASPHAATIHLIVEEPIPELVDADPLASHPLAATERAQIEQQQSIWRLVIPDGHTFGLGNALLAMKWMEALCRASAPCIFIPAIMRLHPVGMIRTLTAQHSAPESMTNLLISAWHESDRMMTRGLTSLGLPELITIIDTGHNAAYFRLMDIATDMILNQTPYPASSQLKIGPSRFRITTARSLDDPAVPVSGSFGALEIHPL